MKTTLEVRFEDQDQRCYNGRDDGRRKIVQIKAIRRNKDKLNTTMKQQKGRELVYTGWSKKNGTPILFLR